MSLIVKTSLEQSKDGTVIYLSDTTGNYDAVTNTTGYGALQVPAGLREIADITGALLQVTIPKSEIVDGQVFIDSVTAQSIASQTATYPITNPLFSSSSSAEVIPDGVYSTNYIVIFLSAASTNRISVTNGSNIITCLDSNTAQFEGATHIIFDPNGVNQQILQIGSIAGNQITTVENYVGTTGIIDGGDYSIGYNSISYIAARVQINSCLHVKIASLSVETCDCRTDKIDNLSLAVDLYYAIQANMDFQKYTHAQKIIDYLTTYCTSDDCSC